MSIKKVNVMVRRCVLSAAPPARPRATSVSVTGGVITDLKMSIRGVARSHVSGAAPGPRAVARGRVPGRTQQ